MTVNLLKMKTRPQSGPAFNLSEIEANLSFLHKGWELVDGALEKRFDFKNFYRTMAFVNAIAWIANSEDHHPDLLVPYDHCIVRFRTHSVNGLSLNDFICAAKTDALVSADE